MGNLLYHFYDDDTRRVTILEPHIVTKTVFNHPGYLAKHPGGSGRLENVTQIDDYNIVFDPETLQSVLSDAELEQYLRQKFDAPQDSADFGQLEFYREFPEAVPSFSDFLPKSAETITEEAKRSATSTLDDIQWEVSLDVREYLARGLCRVLNVPRLFRCLKEAEEAHIDGDTGYDVLYEAKQAQRRDQFNSHLVSIGITTWNLGVNQ